MTIHNIYIFSKDGRMLFYHEWSRKKIASQAIDDEGKLMFGMLYSLKSFVSKISPLSIKERFVSYKTNKYRLTMLEPPSGVKFVINTDVTAVGVQDLLTAIYSQVYVPYVVMNPVCDKEEVITSELFKQKLDDLVKQSALYSGRVG